jgi:peroxiredoxin Q/BCP
VVGVSADTLDDQRAFAAKNNLQFPLIADVDRKVIGAYGVWGERTRPDGTTVVGIRRYTFLIDKDGVVRKTYTNVTPDTHAGEIVADLAGLS